MKSEASRNLYDLPTRASRKVEPIRDPADIARIKAMLKDDPRNYGLFVFGINTAFRASELVLIRIGQIAHLRSGDTFELKEPKTGRHRRVTLNDHAVEAVRRCVAAHPELKPDAPLFWSCKTGRALKPGSIYWLLKGWCARAGVTGYFGSHTLRKTWGYQQRTAYKEPLAKLTKAYGHASERQTLEYLCIQPDEIQTMYMNRI